MTKISDIPGVTTRVPQQSLGTITITKTETHLMGSGSNTFGQAIDAMIGKAMNDGETVSEIKVAISSEQWSALRG